MELNTNQLHTVPLWNSNHNRAHSEFERITPKGYELRVAVPPRFEIPRARVDVG